MNKTVALLWSTAMIALMGLYSCAPTQSTPCLEELGHPPKKNTANRLEQITNLWVGHFSNQKHIASGNTGMVVEQEVIGRRIWKKERFGEYWVFLGWYPAGLYSNPLSTAVAQITRIAPDTSFIAFHRLDPQKSWDPYEWTKASPYAEVSPSELLSCGEGCGSYIVRGERGSYDVIATATPCEDDLSDVLQYYLINATLRSDKIVFNNYLLDDNRDTAVYYPDNTFQRLNRKELERRYQNLPLADL